MDSFVTLRYLTLQPHHRPTGNTKHYYGFERVPVPTPASLAIAKYEGDEGFYLLHLDSSGDELTDTFHLSVDEALAQAEWEFGAKSEEWRIIS